MRKSTFYYIIANTVWSISTTLSIVTAYFFVFNKIFDFLIFLFITISLYWIGSWFTKEMYKEVYKEVK
jgi:uncharacterized membrane protein YciS (DUF1049 family)